MAFGGRPSLQQAQLCNRFESLRTSLLAGRPQLAVLPLVQHHAHGALQQRRNLLKNKGGVDANESGVFRDTAAPLVQRHAQGALQQRRNLEQWEGLA